MIPDEVLIPYCREAKSITLNVKAVGIVAPISLTCRIDAQSRNLLSEEWYQHGLGTYNESWTRLCFFLASFFVPTQIISWGHIFKAQAQPNWIDPTLAKHQHQTLFFSQPRPLGRPPFPYPPSFVLTRVWIVTTISFKCVPNVNSSWQCLNQWHLFMYPKFVLSRMAFW